VAKQAMMTSGRLGKQTAAQQLRSSVALGGAVCILIACVSSCSRLTSPTADAAPDATTATVLRMVDGDTIDVHHDVRGRLCVRLPGIDSPEVHKPGWSIGCWGPESMRFATEALSGQRVSVTADPTQDTHDRYVAKDG
jgi:micrococcal nuclease